MSVTGKILSLVAALALSGCAMTDMAGLGGQDSVLKKIGARFAGPPPARMGVAQGAVVIAGPKGFCIDREVSQDASGQQAITVLSACRELGGGRFKAKPAHPAVLTAAVAPEGRVLEIASAAKQLEAFFASKRGHAALSRSGQPETVRISEQFVENGTFFLHLTDSAPFAWGAVQQDYWRALFPAGGRMVTVAVLALPGKPLGRTEGLQLLREFVAETQAASASNVKPKP